MPDGFLEQQNLKANTIMKGWIHSRSKVIYVKKPKLVIF